MSRSQVVRDGKVTRCQRIRLCDFSAMGILFRCLGGRAHTRSFDEMTKADALREEWAAPSDDLSNCQKKIGYAFLNPQLLEDALKHASGVSHRLASNERMEFLGDAILGFVVCERLYQQYPEYLEGELTKVKSIVVSRDTCAQVCQRIGLHDFLMLGKGMASDPKIPKSVIAAALESIIAAIYLDRGIDAARKFILEHMRNEIEQAVSGEFGNNYKSQLQQYAQREHGVTPIYQLLDEKGPDHSKCFKIAAEVAKHCFPPAWGRSKKESEQRAAHNALSQIQNQTVPYPSDDLSASDE